MVRDSWASDIRTTNADNTVVMTAANQITVKDIQIDVSTRLPALISRQHAAALQACLACRRRPLLPHCSPLNCRSPSRV